jgi:hypothetical protein
MVRCMKKLKLHTGSELILNPQPEDLSGLRKFSSIVTRYFVYQEIVDQIKEKGYRTLKRNVFENPRPY